MFSISNNHDAVAEHLIAAGSNLNLIDHVRNPAYNSCVIRALNISICKSQVQQVPLHLIVSKGKTQLFQLAMQRRPNLNVVDMVSAIFMLVCW